MTAQYLADVLKVDVNDTSPEPRLNIFVYACKLVGSAMGVTWTLEEGLTSPQAAMVMKSAILSMFERIDEVTVIAASRGYLLPDNPYQRFSELNFAREPWSLLVIDEAEATELFESTVELSKVVAGYDAGTIRFDRSQPAAQLASFEVSVDGMTPQSGDALVDILGYQPDADFVKRKRALDSLARLDFSKRKPYLIFTADIVRSGKRSETIVCWSRMRDAAAYTIRKRDVFSMFDLPERTLSNETLLSATSELTREPLFLQVLSFYDWLTLDDVVAFADPNPPNGLYSYEVTGLQTRAPAAPFIFDVPVTALYLTPAHIDAVTAAVAEEANRTGVASPSPYPALSRVIYGDPGFGWVLAGCNVLASRRRGDTADQTRQLSYIGSRIETVVTEAKAGRMVIPSDLGGIQTGVDRAISSYGITQCLLSVMDGVGLTMFISGKDDSQGYQPTEASLEGATGGLARIIAAIDPETATVDPQVLAAGIAAQGSFSGGPRYRSEQVGQVQRDPGELGTELIDLTTYAGISTFMQLVRTIYDFFPGALA